MIYIVMEGGLVQDVVSDDESEIGQQFTVVDYDTEGADFCEIGFALFKGDSPGEFRAVQALVGRGGDITKADIVRTIPGEA